MKYSLFLIQDMNFSFKKFLFINGLKFTFLKNVTTNSSIINKIEYHRNVFKNGKN